MQEILVSYLFYSFFKPFMQVWLIYKAVIISAVQQHDAVIRIHKSILSQMLFPHIDNHRMLDRVLSAVQQVPIGQSSDYGH